MALELLKCSANFTAGFHQLLNEGSFVDCSLAAEGRTLKAHRAVLSAASSYFELLFAEENDRDPVIIFTSIRFNVLETVLRFIYQGEVEVSEDRLAEFLNVLKFLQINRVDCNELVVRETNVTTCENASSFITFEATTTQKSSSVCEKVDGEFSREESADNKHILQQYLHLDERSPTKLSSDYGEPAFGYELSSLISDIDIKDEEINSNQKIEMDDASTGIEDEPTLEEENDDNMREVSPRQDDSSEPAFGYELSSLISDIDIKDEEINSNQKIEMDDASTGIEDEPILEEKNDDNMREVSPRQDDSKYQFEDVMQNKSAVPNNGNGEELFKCPSCDFETSQLSDLNVHTCPIIVKGPFELSDCPLSGMESSAANNHEFKHRSGKPFKCSQCTYACCRKHDLKVHMHSHTGEKPFRCSQCAYATRRKPDLVKHMRTHTGEKPFRCSFCTYASSRKPDLMKHMRTHTGEKPFRCSFCTYASSRKPDLIKHIRTHTGEKPFQCSQCSYVSNQMINLISHMRTHTGEKPYKCSECTYACSHKNSLIYHMRNHKGEKPFKCSECTYSCSRKNDLIEHMSSHIGQKPQSTAKHKAQGKNRAVF